MPTISVSTSDDAKRRRFKFTKARDKHFKRDVAEWSGALDDLRTIFRDLDVRDDKDGKAYVAATLLDLKRNLKSVDEVHTLVYDLDGGQSEDELLKTISDADVAAILHSTYSHKTTRTHVVTEHYEKWAKANKRPSAPTLGFMREYLAAKGKGHLQSIAFDDMHGWERVADKGNCYIIEHAPVDKFRVLLPLDKPIVVSKLASTNTACNDAYKAIYHGVGSHFGFAFDEACADPTRLYYFPSCPKDKIDVAVFYEWDAPLLDWEAIPRAETRKASSSISKPACEIDGRNLRAWPPNRGEFDVEGLIEKYLPDQILMPRSNGGVVVTCPFEAEHSDVGGMGTFACNATDQYPWNIYCSHASCQSEGRKRLDFLREWVTQEFFSLSELEAFSGEKVPFARKDLTLAEKMAQEAALNSRVTTVLEKEFQW